MKISIPIALLLFATAVAAGQSDNQGQDGSGPLQLPVTSAPIPSAGGATLAGTLSIQRFEVRDNKVWAIGMVRGSIAGNGSALGEVVAPVTVTLAGARSSASAAPVAPAATCQVLHLDIGAVNLNVQGVIVATLPINITLSGDTSAPLGNLVCTVQSTLNNVVGLVGLLNQILGLVTGLVGGLVP